jgi:hypothetical protein
LTDDIRTYIDLIENTLPNSLKVEVSSYDFVRLMKEFRSEDRTQAQGDSGLVMFYTDDEKEEFKQFLKSRGIKYDDIGTN